MKDMDNIFEQTKRAMEEFEKDTGINAERQNKLHNMFVDIAKKMLLTDEADDIKLVKEIEKEQDITRFEGLWLAYKLGSALADPKFKLLIRLHNLMSNE